MHDLVYLSLGSNTGDSCTLIRRALYIISHLPGVERCTASSLYRTTPVNCTSENTFINAACALYTTLSPEALYDALHRIEVLLGKTTKEKTAPRLIDIDIVLFGNRLHHTDELRIPHPHWPDRLFVLVPLSELTQTLTLPLNTQGDTQELDLVHYLQSFANPHREVVEKI